MQQDHPHARLTTHGRARLLHVVASGTPVAGSCANPDDPVRIEPDRDDGACESDKEPEREAQGSVGDPPRYMQDRGSWAPEKWNHHLKMRQ